MKNENKRVGFLLPVDLHKTCMEKLDSKGYSNFSEFLREKIRELVNSESETHE